MATSLQGKYNTSYVERDEKHNRKDDIVGTTLKKISE